MKRIFLEISGVFLLMTFVVAGCASHGKPSIASNETSVEGKILQAAQHVSGGKILVIPFTAGEGVAETEDLEKISFRLVQGISNVLQAQPHLSLLGSGRPQDADFVIKGRIVRLIEKKGFPKVFKARDVHREIMVKGELVSRKTGETLGYFMDSLKSQTSQEDLNRLAERLGQRIGEFISRGITPQKSGKLMIVVTGGAGFIGSGVVARLNEMGRDDILVVDHFDSKDDIKRRNLENKRIKDYLDKAEFRKCIRAHSVPGKVDAVIHLGACSSTTLDDAAYYEDNNFNYTCDVAQWALNNHLRFIYASSAATYGDGRLGYSDEDAVTHKLKPLNLYGLSKHKFDLLVLKQKIQNQVVGLKYFNVFGPNEYHKEDMRSVVAKAYPKVANEGKISLFKSYKKEYADGEQKRDFIYVKDAVDMTLFFLEHRDVNGIFNIGSGLARTWNDLALALFAAVGKPPVIEYMEMPESLRPRYQYFTQADMSKLRQAGYVKSLMSLEDAVKDYVGYLSQNRYL